MTVATAAVPSHPGEGTRDRILRLAEELFAEHGFAAVSMRMVAAASGVTKPALYYHFRDKEALFEECVQVAQHHQGDGIAAAVAAGVSLRDGVLQSTLVLLTSGHHPVRLMNDIAEHLPLEVRTRLVEGYSRAVMGPLREMFARAAERGEMRDGIAPATAAAALLGLCMAFLPGAGRELPIGGSAALEPELAATLIADLCLAGVGR